MRIEHGQKDGILNKEGEKGDQTIYSTQLLDTINNHENKIP